MSMAQPKKSQHATETEQIRPFGMRDKIGYLFGDFGNDFFFILVACFFNGILHRCLRFESSSSRIVFMVARVWDAFADVTWGRFIDTRKTTAKRKIQTLDF